MTVEVSTDTRGALEAVLLVAEEPVPVPLLAQLLEIPASSIDEICVRLVGEYAAEGRGFTLGRVAGGWRFESTAAQAPYVERFVLEGRSARLSAAALVTLAVVAYKQPVSRLQVAAIRGVNVDGVVRSLQQRGYISEVGRDDGPGQAVMFGTTALFLERLGLDSLADLPPLGQFMPDPDVVEALEHGLRTTVDTGPGEAPAE
jgi:segregation and condensation protein B